MFDYRFDHDEVIHILGLEKSSPAVQAQILDKIYTQLETMMRARLAGEMDEQDHKTFAELADKDPAEAKAWLDNRFPNSKQMYDEELEDLVYELKRHADTTIDVLNDRQQS